MVRMPYLGQGVVSDQPTATAILTEPEVRALNNALRYLATKEGMRYVNCPKLVSESYPGPRAMIFPDPLWLRLQEKVGNALAVGGKGMPVTISLEGDEVTVAKVVLDCYMTDQAQRGGIQGTPLVEAPSGEPSRFPILPVVGGLAAAGVLAYLIFR